MNEELIQRLMADSGMTREQAIQTLQNTSSVEQNFLNAFAGGNTQQTIMTPSINGASPQLFQAPPSPMSTLPTSSGNKPLLNSYGGINWDVFSPTQQVPMPQSEIAPLYTVQGDQANKDGIAPTQQPPLTQADMGTLAFTMDKDGNMVPTNQPASQQAPIDQNGNPLNPFEQAAVLASYINPYGMDLETELYTFGRALGMQPTTQRGKIGRGLTLVGSAGAALLGGTRSALSGYSNSIANNRYWQWMQERQRRANERYSPNSQTQNSQANMLGGITQA